MNPRYKKIYCCTPVAFPANEHFFIRDTGLISRTLQSMGIESKCIMPLPYHDSDQREGIIRTEYKNLRSVSWWKSLGIDAVILYSWGAPRYTLIARAIHKAGIKQVIHLDTSGNFNGEDWDELPWYKKIARFIRTNLSDIIRAKHLSYADVLTMGKPACSHISRRLFYCKSMQDKCFPMPCPVSPLCKYEGEDKQDVILCIGRWHDEYQKRSKMLMQTLEVFLQHNKETEIRIFGNLTEELRTWHKNLPNDAAGCVKLLGFVSNDILREEYKQAKVVLCTSRYESSHIVSGEGLCCGCSVVVPNRPYSLCDLLWYTTEESGTVSEEDTPTSLAKALLSEIAAWKEGKRNAQDIAKAWHPYFHADKVLNQIFSH